MLVLPCAAALAAAIVPRLDGAAAAPPSDTDAGAGFTRGNPGIRAMSVLEFGPTGTLFVGDTKAGAVFALELDGETPRGEVEKPIRVGDLEGKLAAMLGASPSEVMVHDLAVHPLSKNHFLAVSRGRQAWTQRWDLPNDVADATLLVRVTPEGAIDEVPLADVRFQRAALPNPVAPEKRHPWKEDASLRSEAITDLVYADGTLWVAGLSNEEFASTLWRLPFPFGGEAAATSLEIFHGAHGKYETEAPIRTFLRYEVGGQQRVLASYLCTPLVTFDLDELVAGAHVKGKTVAEFGSGNYPMDMVVYRKNGRDRILMANSMLPLLSFDPEDVAKHPGISEEVPTYTYGVPYVARAAAGVQHIANYGETLIAALQRAPNGQLELTALPVAWL
jgi:hypothetical protein